MLAVLINFCSYSAENCYNRCRWSTSPGEPLLFLKYNASKLIILDAEKQVSILKEPIMLSRSNECPFFNDLLGENSLGFVLSYIYPLLFAHLTNLYLSPVVPTYWIDVCPVDGNLLATSQNGYVKLFDNWVAEVVRTIYYHQGKISLVCLFFLSNYRTCKLCTLEWNGDMIASASVAGTAQLLDLKSGKIIYTGKTSGGDKLWRNIYS